MKIYRITKQQLLGCTLDRFVEQCSHILLSIPKKLIFKKILSAIILLDYKKSFFRDKTQKLKKNHQFTANFPELFGIYVEKLSSCFQSLDIWNGATKNDLRWRIEDVTLTSAWRRWPWPRPWWRVRRDGWSSRGWALATGSAHTTAACPAQCTLRVTKPTEQKHLEKRGWYGNNKLWIHFLQIRIQQFF